MLRRNLAHAWSYRIRPHRLYLNRQILRVGFHKLLNLGETSNLTQRLIFLLFKNSLAASIARVVQHAHITCSQVKLELAELLFVELSEGHTDVGSSHHFLEIPIIVHVFQIVFCFTNASQLLLGVIFDVKARIDQLLLEEEAMHHVG